MPDAEVETTSDVGSADGSETSANTEPAVLRPRGGQRTTPSTTYATCAPDARDWRRASCAPVGTTPAETAPTPPVAATTSSRCTTAPGSIPPRTRPFQSLNETLGCSAA